MAAKEGFRDRAGSFTRRKHYHLLDNYLSFLSLFEAPPELVAASASPTGRFFLKHLSPDKDSRTLHNIVAEPPCLPP